MHIQLFQKFFNASVMDSEGGGVLMDIREGWLMNDCVYVIINNIFVGSININYVMNKGRLLIGCQGVVCHHGGPQQ